VVFFRVIKNVECERLVFEALNVIKTMQVTRAGGQNTCLGRRFKTLVHSVDMKSSKLLMRFQFKV